MPPVWVNCLLLRQALAQRKKDADELHALTLAARNRPSAARVVRGPVSITFAWDDGLDIDNHAAIAKAVVDALKGYLLPDDDHRWYRQVIHRLWDGGCIRVEVQEL